MFFQLLSVVFLNCFLGLGEGEQRVPAAGQQVLPGSGRGGCRQHHAGHLHQKLRSRRPGDSAADAVPQ